jgi:hypothetical protein
VRAALARDFGRDVLQEAGATVGTAGSSASPTPASPSAPASPKAAGRTVTVPVREEATAGTGVLRRGWELAHWAVANSSSLHIERVSYAGREWTAGTSEGSWHTTDEKGGSGARKAAAEVRIVTGQ